VDVPNSRPFNSTVILTNRFAERRGAANDPTTDREREVLEPGAKVGRYLILNRLGGGGMGLVYKAHDTELNRTVALKVLPHHLCERTDYLARFRAEAQAQARLNTPHVVQLYSMMEESAGEVLVLEYVEGETLEQRLRARGALSVSDAVSIIEQVLAGVEHIHHQGVVHRDLKPSNIFVTHDGRIKISDFGVARLIDQQPHQRGTMVGTLLYMSPEQINGHDTDFRSDIYTIGITLFEAVTGRLPFERRTDYSIMHAHVQEAPPRPQDYARRIPPALEWVILKAIEKDRERRFQNAADFRFALLRLGLIERRQRGRRRADNHAQTDELKQELARYRLLPKRRFSGLWLDGALAAIAFGLVIGLGLAPLSTEKPEEPKIVAKPATKPAPKPKAVAVRTTRTKPAAPIEKPVAKEPARKVAKKPVAPPPAKQDNYDALRKAWGG